MRSRRDSGIPGPVVGDDKADDLQQTVVLGFNLHVTIRLLVDGRHGVVHQVGRHAPHLIRIEAENRQ